MVDVLAALIGRQSQAEVRHDPLSGDWSGLFYNGEPLFPYPLQTIRTDREKIGNHFKGYAEGGYQASGVVFSLILIRMQVFSQARSVYRYTNAARFGEIFSASSLDVLNRPSPGGGGVAYRSRALVDADLAGNSYAVRRGQQIKRLRPDWVTIILGGGDPDLHPSEDPDAEVVGYMYHPGGMEKTTREKRTPIMYLPGEVAHWAPIPDPLANYRGMSWLTPVVREVIADKQATEHKQKFFENGATPNMIVKHQISDPDTMAKWIELFKDTHEGSTNAYKTLHLGAGADATVVGRDMRQLDFKAVQGAGETRIAAASGVGAVMAQFSEGLQGSSLNAGNYGASRRRLADTVFPHLWQTFAESYERIIPVPRNAQLWYDDEIQFLSEDAKDAADIEQIKSTTIRNLIDGGFEPDSVVAAVTAEDMKLLSHTGKVSVQLQDPNASDVDPDAAPTDSMTPAEADARGLPEDFKLRFDSVGLLIRSGFKPQAALAAVGLDPIEHFDLLPITVQNPSKVLDDGTEPDLGGLDPELSPDTEPEAIPDPQEPPNA